MDVTPNPTVHAQKTSLYFFAPLRDSLARELDSPFIKRGTMTHFATRLLIGSALLMALNLHADEAPADGQSPLDELLSTPISTAAKYQQSMSDVAASVTVITAEEIARYGWRSLGEVLTALTRDMQIDGIKTFFWGLCVIAIVLYRPTGLWPWLRGWTGPRTASAPMRLTV